MLSPLNILSKLDFYGLCNTNRNYTNCQRKKGKHFVAQNHQWFGQQTLPIYTDSFKLYLHWQGFIALTPAPARCNSHYCACLSHLGQHDTDRGRFVEQRAHA
jgi:hypothetical protein